jgi:hypothetical protein
MTATPQSRFLPLTSGTNPTGYRFLDIKDITDSLALDFIKANDGRITAWLDLVDGEILSLAQEKEVPLTALTVPLHKKVLEYCKAYFCFACFQDAYGRNDIAQTQQETLKLKLDWYEARCSKLRLQMTKEMLLYTNLSLQSSQRAGGTVSILRG